jgi:hypothetical protein
MFILTKKQIRPNTSVEFASMQTFADTDPAFKPHFFSTYLSTGKMVSSEDSVSENGLEKTTVTIWADSESYNAFKEDPICIPIMQLYATHCVDNGIDNLTESQTV